MELPKFIVRTGAFPLLWAANTKIEVDAVKVRPRKLSECEVGISRKWRTKLPKCGVLELVVNVPHQAILRVGPSLAKE
jgi:hypothetical protein